MFPDGSKEQGRFDGDRFHSGYRREVNGQINFLNPKALVACHEDDSKRNGFLIVEVEGKLVVLKKTDLSHYSISEMSVGSILLEFSQRSNSIDRRAYSLQASIKPVLGHRDFESHRGGFIESMFTSDDTGQPRLFKFSNTAVMDILEADPAIKDSDLWAKVNPLSGRNFFIDVARRGHVELLGRLILRFPHAFRAIGPELITEYLQQGHSRVFVENFSEKFEAVGGVLDGYYRLWVHVARGGKPDEEFKRQFDQLSAEHRQVLYDAAFTYNNPYLHQPPDVPVKAEQYSVNLMWINKDKIPADREFLLGNGETLQQRQQDFQTRFIEPISRWAKANLGPINIWVDSAMARQEVIDTSHAVLRRVLEGASHGAIVFRDVRSLEVVRLNPEVFSEKMPVYFRVDLLRAIAADHTLRNRETQYFVYGDIDMDPLSGQELFDRRTVHFLNDYGMVLAKGGHLGFENGFQILNGDKRLLMEAHRKIIIDLSVEMARERPNAIKEQQIYDTYPAMMTYFLDRDGRFGHFDIKSRTQQVSAAVLGDGVVRDVAGDPEMSATQLQHFRYDRFKTSAHLFLPLGEGKVETHKIMPTKPVCLPPSQFG